MATTAGGEKLFDENSDTVGEQLYRHYGLLEAADKAARAGLEASFQALIDATSSENARVRQLVAQFIPKFFVDFPHLSETALSNLFDLAEDTVNAVRMAAVKALSHVAVVSPPHSGRIAFILGQLLIADSAAEVAQAKAGLAAALKTEPTQVITSLFGHLAQDGPGQPKDAVLRERVLEFVAPTGASSVLSEALKGADDALQAIVVAQVQRVLASWPECPEPAFRRLFSVASSLPRFKGDSQATTMGELIAILHGHSGLGGDAVPADKLATLQTTFKLATPLYRAWKRSVNQHNSKLERDTKKAAAAAAAAAAKPAAEGEAKTEEAAPVAAAPEPLSPPPGFAFITDVASKVLKGATFDAMSALDKKAIMEAFAQASDLATDAQAALLLPQSYRLLVATLTPPEGEAAAPAPAPAASGILTGLEESKAPEAPAAKTAGPNFSLVECTLHVFHVFASRDKASLGPLCGLKDTPKVEFTGQPTEFETSPDENPEEAARLRGLLGSTIKTSRMALGKLKKAFDGVAGKEAAVKNARQAMAVIGNVLKMAEALAGDRVQVLARQNRQLSFVNPAGGAGNAGGKNKRGRGHSPAAAGAGGAAGAAAAKGKAGAGGKKGKSSSPAPTVKKANNKGGKGNNNNNNNAGKKGGAAAGGGGKKGQKRKQGRSPSPAKGASASPKKRRGRK